MKSAETLIPASKTSDSPAGLRIPLAAIVFFLAFIAMSPVLAAVGFKGTLVLVAAVGVLLINGRIRFDLIHKALYAFGSFYLLVAAALGLYWGTPVPLFFGVLYIATIVVVANSNPADLDRIVDYATVLLGVMVVLGWIGMLYFFAGGPPLAGIRNPDGR